MLEKGVSPDSRTFVVALQVCGMLAEKEDAVTVKGDLVKSRSLKMGKEMHASAQRNGSDRGLFVGSSLIGMYWKCGSVVDARNVFEALLERNMVYWTVMLAAYVQQGQAMEALQLYKQMQEEGLSPDIRTYASAIQACGKLAEVEQGIPGDQQSKSADKGKAVHTRAWRKGYGMDVVVGSALTSMYAKCGTILDAQIVFDRLSG